MKHLGKRKSPLYKYNSRTYSYSFGKQNKIIKRLTAILVTIAILLCIAIGLKCYFHNSANAVLTEVPPYSGNPYCEINNNIPFFDKKDATEYSFEKYGELDYLGRCTYAYANLSLDLMPTEERKSIHSVEPSGWQSTTYDFIDQEHLYNRCHLIAFMLSGENANEKNLITGTRYMNVEGMLPFEKRVAKYIELTGNHVLYRVTPFFEGRNLVATGVEMEALSVEDGGENICFNVFIYNVQPGVEIDYRTGNSRVD